MSDDSNDVLSQYQAISNKLKKKRILKKPNVAEASQQFESLALSCEREELPQYAGLSYHAAAKCQNSLGNSTDEGFLLLKASKQYMTTQLRLSQDELVSLDENLHHSITHYHECLERLQAPAEPGMPSGGPLCGAIALSMANTLDEGLSRRGEAAVQYRRAGSLLSSHPVEVILCLEQLTHCYIQLGEYDEALKSISESWEACQGLPPSGFRTDVLRNAEITRVLLLLLLRPAPQQISASHAKILEKYAWVDAGGGASEISSLRTFLANQNLDCLPEETFLGLQSLVMMSQSGEMTGLTSLEDELTSCLTYEQRDLLRVLVKSLLRKL